MADHHRDQARPGAALAKTRRDLGISQAQLAARLGTTQSAIARLEGDRLSPSLRTLESAYAALSQRLLLVAVAGRPAYTLRSPSPGLLVAEGRITRYDAGHADAVDMTQIHAARALSPAERLDRLAAGVRGLDDLLEAVRR